jgi:hypothetical protein
LSRTPATLGLYTGPSQFEWLGEVSATVATVAFGKGTEKVAFAESRPSGTRVHTDEITGAAYWAVTFSRHK